MNWFSVTSSQAEMFSPPVNRAMQTLDRNFFRKEVPLAGALVHEHNQISRCRSYLGRDVLKQPLLSSVVVGPREQGLANPKKMILLHPSIRPNGLPTPTYAEALSDPCEEPASWSARLRELIEQHKVSISAYDLSLTYDNWDYRMNKPGSFLKIPASETVR